MWFLLWPSDPELNDCGIGSVLQTPKPDRRVDGKRETSSIEHQASESANGGWPSFELSFK